VLLLLSLLSFAALIAVWVAAPRHTEPEALSNAVAEPTGNTVAA